MASRKLIKPKDKDKGEELLDTSENRELKDEDKDEGKNKDTTVIPIAIPDAASDTDYPRLSLKVFCHLSGKKPDQIAGFRRYAITQKLDLLTVPQWREKLVEFQNKPTR